MRIWLFIKPTAQKLLLLSLTLLLWVIPTLREGIRKGTWEQHHGFPITFISLVESTVGGGYQIWISRFYFASLIIDIAILYLISCIVFFSRRETS